MFWKKKDKETFIVNGEEIEWPDRPKFFTWRNLEYHVIGWVFIFGVYCLGLMGSHLILGKESVWIILAIGLPLLGIFMRYSMRSSREEISCSFNEAREKINDALLNSYHKKCEYLIGVLDEHGIDYKQKDSE